MTSTTPHSVPSDQQTVSGRAAALALVVVLFASFMDLLDVTIVTVAAPEIATDLGASQAQLQWMLAAYTLALGSGLITGGRVGDDYGRRKVFLLSLSGFALASAACALAPSAGVLIAVRAIQGLTGGFMVPQVFGIIRSSFDPAAMAKAFGAYGAVQGLASVAGPLIGGALVDADLWGLGWRTIFWINVPVAVVALLVGLRVLPESKGATREQLDLAGAVLAALGVVLVLLPLVQGRDWGWPIWGWALCAGGIGILGIFLTYERSVARSGGQPVLDPALLRGRPFAAGLVAASLFFGGLASFFLMLSIYLQAGTGRSAWETGLVILPYAVGSMVTSGAGVALASKAGRTLIISGSLILAVSQGLLWWLLHDGGTPGYWALAVSCSSVDSGWVWGHPSWSAWSLPAYRADTPVPPAEHWPRSTRSVGPSASHCWERSFSPRSHPPAPPLRSRLRVSCSVMRSHRSCRGRWPSTSWLQ